MTTLRGSIYTVGGMPGSGAQTAAAVATFVGSQNGAAPPLTSSSNTASGGGTFNANGGSACSGSPIASPADENAINPANGFENNLRFLNASYQSSLELIAAFNSSKFQVPSSKFEASESVSSPSVSPSVTTTDIDAISNGQAADTTEMRSAHGPSADVMDSSEFQVPSSESRQKHLYRPVTTFRPRRLILSRLRRDIRESCFNGEQSSGFNIGIDSV